MTFCKLPEQSGKLCLDLITVGDALILLACGNSGAQAKLEVDHIISADAGGSDEMDNLQALCFDCNRGKGASV